jgi:hypothetical protein
MSPRFRALALGCALLLGGCNPTTVGIAATPFLVKGESVNLLNASYAAADTLSVQTKQKLPPYSTLSVMTLEEIIDTSREKIITNPKLGTIMSDQIRSRFMQLGYQVAESGAKGQVSGVYEVVGQNLAIRLRMKNARTGALYGQYDYWLPITSDIRRYMNPNGGGIPVYRLREGIDGIVDR